jgi:hypothetical protein
VTKKFKFLGSILSFENHPHLRLSDLCEHSENPLEQAPSPPKQKLENGFERSLQEAHTNSTQKSEFTNNQ